jgi:hypothetical protein
MGFDRIRLAVVMLLAVAAAPALAHHGWGGYDAGTPLTLSGVIKRVGFENPHGTIILATADKEWEVVLAPPYRMINRGLKEAMLKIGDRAEVYGYPSRSVATELRAERITVGGATTELR